MVSVSKKIWMVWLVVLSLLLAACERPFQPSSDVPTGPDTSQVTPDTGVDQTTPDAVITLEVTETPVPEQGQETGGETATPDPNAGQETGGETDTGGEGQETGGEETTDGETTEGGETAEEPAGDDSSETDTADEGQETGGEEATNNDTAQESGNTTSGQTGNPAVHVVVVGDTLYKIGLKYGISWVRLAEFNNLSNPNQLTIGQQIKLPGSDTTEPTPSPQTEEIYTVKAGDNLYRIGLAYGIGWVQIAEANGIMNPNFLIVGQQIKIPISAPGPTPQFSHTVRAGDTVFTISLQYGVPWTSIAEVNDIESPYVIFPGQVLKIPGG